MTLVLGSVLMCTLWSTVSSGHMDRTCTAFRVQKSMMSDYPSDSPLFHVMSWMEIITSVYHSSKTWIRFENVVKYHTFFVLFKKTEKY
jgi:hypothetical protein